MERRCQSCNAEVSENAKFCRVCGGKVETITTKVDDNQCPECGQGIPLGAKFCRHCGSKRVGTGRGDETPAAAPPKPLEPVCGVCGSALNKTSKFCRSCGAPVSHVSLEGIASEASEVPGEFVFPAAALASAASKLPVRSPLMDMAAYTGPLRILFSGCWHLFTGFFSALRSPGRLLPGFLLGLVWLVVSTLPALGIILPGQDIASWLTFAQGGLQGGAPGMVGGILGKGVFAAALIGIFKRNPQRGNDLENKNPNPQKRGAFSLMLIGMGLALILYNFFTWDNSLQNSMIGILAALGTLRAMGRSNGFLQRLVTALAQRFSPKRMAGHKDIKLLGGGLATGFALAVPMSVIAGPFTGYALGLVFLLPGMLFAMLRRPGKAVKSA